MVGLIAGIASGAIQFWLLSKFTRSVTGGAFGVKAVSYAISQFFLPLIILLCFALLYPGGLLWAGIGMAVALLGSALVFFFLRRKTGRDLS